MSAYPPELVDAVAAELAALAGSEVFNQAAGGWFEEIRDSYRGDARRILDVLDREGVLCRGDRCATCSQGGTVSTHVWLAVERTAAVADALSTSDATRAVVDAARTLRDATRAMTCRIERNKNPHAYGPQYLIRCLCHSGLWQILSPDDPPYRCPVTGAAETQEGAR